MPEQPIPEQDPIVTKSYTLYYAVSMVLLIATLFWALADENWGQRPWKAFQHEWKDRYSAFLKTAKTKSETVKNLANAARDIHDAHADAADRAFVQQQYQAPGTLPDPTLGAGVPGPGPAPVAPPPGFGPVPGATSPSQDVPSNFQGVLPFPGMMPPGARQAG